MSFPSLPDLSTEELNRALRELAPEYQLALRLHLEGRSIEEISELTGWTSTAFRRVFAKARRRLFAALDWLHSRGYRSSIIASDIVESVRCLEPELIAHFAKYPYDIRKLPADVFEHLIAEFFASWDFENVFVVGKNKWTGADVVAMQRGVGGAPPIRFFIEAKCWGDSVGIEVIEKVYGAYSMQRPTYGWHLGMVVSATRFTDSARYTAGRMRHMGIELRDNDDLKMWCEQYVPSKSGLWLPDLDSSLAKAAYER